MEDRLNFDGLNCAKSLSMGSLALTIKTISDRNTGRMPEDDAAFHKSYQLRREIMRA